jgi:fumarate reductase flavoprotein subunit
MKEVFTMVEKNCDLVVVGGGGSGMVAAVRAAERSGKKVIVLEKGKVTGGGMLFASTMRTFQSQWQAERNIPDQSNDFIRKMMDLTMWKLDARLVKNAVLGTGAFFDWYSQYETPEVMAKYEARPYVFDIPVNGQPGPQIDTFHNGSGRFIMDTMRRKGEELGVEFLTRHRAVDAEVTDGKITAILAESPDGTVKISCKACILACGSWICNKEVTQKVCPAFVDAEVLPNAHQNPNYTGDGLPIAEKVGAFVDWNSFCLRLMGPICSFGEQSPFDALTHADCAILVDLNAKRFVAEPMVPRMDPFDTGHVLLQHPRGKSFYLFSANTLQSLIDSTQANGDSPDFDPFGIPTLPPMEEVKGWFRSAMEKGSKEVGFADTVEELAEQIGLDPTALKETIDTYNADCAGGADWGYFKDPSTMIPLSEGPFFAIGGKLSTDGAFGGVRVDPNMQAYRPDGSLVEGLYVTGDFASGRHIVMDGVKKQVINDMSWALSSGFLAGTSAADYLK